MMSIRGFRDEPEYKTLGEETNSFRSEFENYILSRLGTSMITHGYPDQDLDESGGKKTGHKFFHDLILLNRMIIENPITVDPAAQANDSWNYCYLNKPHIATSKNLNIIVFTDQEYTITNTGSSAITVKRRYYNFEGKHHILNPVTVTGTSKLNV